MCQTEVHNVATESLLLSVMLEKEVILTCSQQCPESVIFDPIFIMTVALPLLLLLFYINEIWNGIFFVRSSLSDKHTNIPIKNIESTKISTSLMVYARCVLILLWVLH